MNKSYLPALFILEPNATEYIQSHCDILNQESIVKSLSLSEKEFLNELQAQIEFKSWVLPAQWAALDLWSEFSQKINDGIIRIAFWGEVKDNQNLTFPYTTLNPVQPEALLNLSLRELALTQSPGTQCFSLNKEKKIFMDRVTLRTDIGTRIDQSISFFEKENDSKTYNWMSIRLGVFSVFADAFDRLKLLESKSPFSPIKMQATTSENIIVYSIRWREPAPINYSDLKQSLSSISSSKQKWVRIIKESNEVEVITSYASVDLKNNKTKPHVDFDIITNLRTQSQISLSTPAYSTFDKLPPLPETNTIIEGDAPQEIESIIIKGNDDEVKKENYNQMDSTQSELQSIKLENNKLQSVIEFHKNKISDLNKKINELLENEKSLQKEIKLNQKNGTQNPFSHEAVLKTEIDILKKKLDTSKTRENELIKKLSMSIDQIKKLQLEIKSLQRVEQKAS